MLTRIQISGFKNLVDVDVRLGPFTCVAGPNASGKSNFFDAINFLSRLADRPLMEAAAGVRGDTQRAFDVTNLFHRWGSAIDRSIRFNVEMLIPAEGTDTLGQTAEASTTFLSYSLELGLRQSSHAGISAELEVLWEELDRIRIKDAAAHLPFDHTTKWRSSVAKGRRQSPLISTEEGSEGKIINIHQDQRAGRKRHLLAHKLPRTALSSSDAAETPTALLARREMQSWREFQLEPSALRQPDSFRAPGTIGADGSCLASTVWHLYDAAESQRQGGGDDFLAELANRLAALIEDVGRIELDQDHTRELVTLVLTDRIGTRHPARSLSDGTLRFLALSVIEADPRFQGLLCLEEPENGIHPDRIRPMLQLLRDISVDVSESVSAENPLRQVIVNTHSPAVVGEVRDDELLVAVPVLRRFEDRSFTTAAFRWLSDTWRASSRPEVRTLSRGSLISYLSAGSEEEPSAPTDDSFPDRPRVKDREDIRQLRLSLA